MAPSPRQEETLLIPQHISKYGLISGQLFLINSFVCKYHNYNTLSALLFVLYITTLLHWHKIKHKGLIRSLDIFFAIITISRITFYDSYHFILDHKLIWDLYTFSSIFIFLINEYFFYININNTINDAQRIYYINVIIHIISLHILPNLLCIFFILKT
jgi:hypothetical protein